MASLNHTRQRVVSYHNDGGTQMPIYIYGFCVLTKNLWKRIRSTSVAKMVRMCPQTGVPPNITSHCGSQSWSLCDTDIKTKSSNSMGNYP